MASFFEDIYHMLFPPRSRPPFSPSQNSFLSPPTMTPHQQDNYTSLMSPSESAISDSAPSAGSGYFPSSPRSSMSSGISTRSDLADMAQPVTCQPAPQQPQVKLDAMSRHFPKPDREPTLEELLARPPGKWSLGHYVKNARDVKAPAVDKAKQTKEFEDAKRELLRAKEEMKKLGVKRG